MKEMKKKGTCLVGEDMISKLPDALISEVLFYLPTKEAVRTSVLSRRWQSIWLLIPGLDLDSSEFQDYNAFVIFVNKFVDFSKEHKSCLHKLKLKIHKDKNDESCVAPWVDFVATPKLKLLEVEFGPVKRECLEVMPVSLFISEKLLFLRLHRVFFGSLDSVSLPQLKTMGLEENVYANQAGLLSLITSCPVLEDLIIVRKPGDNVKVLCVRSQTLITLSISNVLVEFDDAKSVVLINAPRLKYLILDDVSYAVAICNSGSLTKVDLRFFNSSSLTNVCNFLTSISGVKDMSMSWIVYEFIVQIIPFSPQFWNLSCLEIEIYVTSLRTLPKVLERCPNLKSLILVLEIISADSVPDQLKLSSVPGCLLASLEFVEIKSIHYYEWSIDMELARYFTENALVLKKLVLPLRSSMLEKDALALRDLLALPRRSSTCQIVVI